MKRKIVAVALSVLMLGNICIPTLATSTSELREQKQEIESKIKEVQGEQAEVKEQLTAQMAEISSLDVSIADLNSQIDALNEQIEGLETSIAETQKKLDEKQVEHDKNQALMEERLVVMYESGETTFLDMLFSSKNIVEFISSYYMMSQINQCDQELLEKIEKEQAEIEAAKEKLETEKTQVASSKKEKETKNSLLKAQKAERQEKVNSLSEEQQSLQTDIDKYQKQADQVEAEIQAALRKAAEEAARRSGGSSSGGTGGNGLEFDGSFIWPCDNKIVTSTVKRRWGRMHKGIDIGARYENVYASASGYAYTLENPSGYGHYIIIIHGDGYISLYGHLNAFKVSYGQYVSQGQVIAQSGNTGSSTGAHLHFEIRRATSISNYFSASPLNPLNYLPGGYSFTAGAQTPS